MGRAPLVCVAFGVGIGTALALANDFEQNAVALIASAALCAALLVKPVQRSLAPLAIAALLGGYVLARFHLSHQTELSPGRTHRYAAVVLNSAASAVHLFQTTLQLDDGRTLLATFAQAPPPPGTTISVRGRVEPFDAPRNAGEPDERAIERERGFEGVLADAVILRTLAGQRASPKIWLARLQAAAGERLRRTISEPYASVLAGELWGEKSALPATLRQEFQDSGTVHVLVTAGLHLAVVAWLSMLFTARLEMPRQAACALAAAVVWGYALFSGLHLPAMRAAMMVTFALIARACGAKALSWNALAAAAVVALLHDPQSIQSVSFWMSFSCVGAIFLTAPLIKPLVEKVEALPPVVTEAFTLSAATQIGIWPLTAVTFLLFAPYSVVANAAVVPLVGATMLMGTAQIIFADVTPLANAVATINSFALQFVLAVIQSVAALPFAHVVMTPPALWAIAVYDGALCTAVWLLRRNARTAAAAIAIVAGLLVLSPPRHADARLKITVLDVGQADAIVIQTPRGHALLVDAGGRLERGPKTAADSQAEHIGETIVAPFLIRAGVHRLDAIVLSHPHGDHKRR